MFKRSRTLRPKMGWRARVKRWLFWLGFLTVLFLVNKFIAQVRSVPDYRGGEAYVSYSPYGHYKMSRIYPPEKPLGGGASLFFSLFMAG